MKPMKTSCATGIRSVVPGLSPIIRIGEELDLPSLQVYFSRNCLCEIPDQPPLRFQKSHNLLQNHSLIQITHTHQIPHLLAPWPESWSIQLCLFFAKYNGSTKPKSIAMTTRSNVLSGNVAELRGSVSGLRGTVTRIENDSSPSNPLYRPQRTDVRHKDFGTSSR